MIQSELTTLGLKWLIGDGADTTVTAGSDCAYDRFVVNSDFLSRIRLEYSNMTANVTIFNYHKAYAMTDAEALAVSDHYPIVIELEIDGSFVLPLPNPFGTFLTIMLVIGGSGLVIVVLILVLVFVFFLLRAKFSGKDTQYYPMKKNEFNKYRSAARRVREKQEAQPSSSRLAVPPRAARPVVPPRGVAPIPPVPPKRGKRRVDSFTVRADPDPMVSPNQEEFMININ